MAKTKKITDTITFPKKFIDELSVSLRNMNEDLLVDILNEFSINSEIANQRILQFNIDYEKRTTEADGSDYSRKFIEIGEKIFEIKLLLSFSKKEIYNDNSNNGLSYHILINEDKDSKGLIYNNSLLTYYSEKQRDLAWMEIKKKLKFFNSITFL